MLKDGDFFHIRVFFCHILGADIKTGDMRLVIHRFHRPAGFESSLYHLLGHLHDLGQVTSPLCASISFCIKQGCSKDCDIICAVLGTLLGTL